MYTLTRASWGRSVHVDASGPLATGPGCNVELGSWNAPLVIENSYVSSDSWLLPQSSKLSMCEHESAISLLTLYMFICWSCSGSGRSGAAS